MKQEVFLECAMAVDVASSGDAAGRAADRTSARRRSSSGGGGGDVVAAAPGDVLLLDDTPVGTPCSDFLAIVRSSSC
ncbi:hypothetical protein MTO96_034661 [Rhipicephalus appendiculatus]